MLRLNQATLFAVAISAFAQQAVAAERLDFNIPAGRLGDALIAIGRQAGVTIGTAEAAISSTRVRGVRGRYTLNDALRRLLKGTQLRVVQIDGQSFTVIRAPPISRPAVLRQRPVPTKEQVAPPPDIVVTASKRSVPLGSFPATVQILDLETDLGPPTAATGSDSLISRLPVLASTALGRGRNKLFIRGIADSSFTGPTQATVGQYLGDVRLNYNAPDPDLSLYDMARVEVIEGPQGTLYGAGSLGGIVRLIPHAPDTRNAAASISAGVTATRRGDWGYDVAGMVNLPVVDDHVALRLVGYQLREGGYIDDLQRDRRDVNRTRIRGGRGALRVTPGDSWTVDFGAVVQMINARDSQYAEPAASPLGRRSAIAQPFDNDYALWHGTVRKAWNGVELVLATGFVRHDVGQRYDATGFPGTAGPIAFGEDDNIRLLTHETRLSGKGRNGGWLIGIAAVRDIDRIVRRLGPPDATQKLVGVRNAVTEASLFGEGTLAVTGRLDATLGARLTYAHVTGRPLDAPDLDEFEPARNETRLLPTAAFSWRPKAGLLAFARYQEGFRAGGLSISQAADRPTVNRFRPDRMRSIEAGVRIGETESDAISGAATVSYTRWRNIQADLIEPGSLPTTLNIGNGRIYGFEASARWRPFPSVTLNAAIFLNDSGLGVPAQGADRFEIEELPNIARFGAVGTAGWRTSIAPGLDFAAEATVRYVGRSTVGIGPLDLSQGGYLDASISTRFEWRSYALSLGITNIADARANRFALGNPFSTDPEGQTTPLRPRSIRLGLDTRF